MVKGPRGHAAEAVLDKEQRGTVADWRQNGSLLAFIADNDAAPALLPLILLRNERHVSAAPADPLQAHLPGPP